MFELPSRSKKSQDIATPKGVPNYFSRREQMRLLVMVGSLMLVIVLAWMLLVGARLVGTDRQSR